MQKGVTKLSSANLAPADTKCLAIYDGSKKVGEIDCSKMLLPTNIGTKQYSFGVLSDVHCCAANDTEHSANGTKFHNALSFFESQGCSFCCVSGDLTNIGLYYEGDKETLYPYQFNEFKRVCDLHSNLDVYSICGNHESYVNPIIQNPEHLQYYTGNGLTYTIAKGNDLFVFVGQPEGTLPMSDDGLVWLGDKLEANKHKRCFVFIHPFVATRDSGNPLGLHHVPLFDTWAKKQTFINLLKVYPNAILFHGHSHMDFENQFVVKNANYSATLGFKSVHIPATAYTRNVSTGAIVQDPEGQQGYVCEVYENHIVLKGYDFQKNASVPIAQYCIPTAVT